MKNLCIFLLVLISGLVGCTYEYSSQIPDSEWRFDTIPTDKRALVIILDTSDSMEGEKMDQAKKALSTYISSLEEDVVCGLVTFGQGDLGIGSPRDYLIKKVKEVSANGDTPLTEAVFTAHGLLESLHRKTPVKEYHIAIITDGAANNARSLNGLVSEIIEKRPIVFTTIGFQIEGGHSLNRTGVQYIEASDLVELERGLKEILLEAPITPAG